MLNCNFFCVLVAIGSYDSRRKCHAAFVMVFLVRMTIEIATLSIFRPEEFQEIQVGRCAFEFFKYFYLKCVFIFKKCLAAQLQDLRSQIVREVERKI